MKLSVQIEFDKTLDLETSKSSVTVGRSPKTDLQIPHDSVSREHCRIDFIKGMFYITDLGSSNGTFIDGQRLEVNQKTPVLSSSQLTIGKLDCELSETTAPIQNSDTAKIISSNVSSKGDYTATMRIARIDINKQTKRTAEATPPKVKGPRNPVSEGLGRTTKAAGESKFIYIVLFILISIAEVWMINKAMK